MSKKKLQRFEEMKGFNNVFEPTLDEVKNGDYFIKGKWHQDYFKNNYPIVLELGCGKGEYTIGMAKKFPDKNYIGIDIKGARMWRGAKMAHENDLKNVAFLRSRIDFIESFFAPNEVDEIWLTFPDPQPQKSKIKRRLTSPKFIGYYKSFLKPKGIFHLKTDAVILYEYTLEVIKENSYTLLNSTNDLYEKLISLLDNDEREILSIKTFYENIFLKKGKKICYLSFQIIN